MKTYRVEPTDKALVDAGEAYFWINEQSEGAALRWYEGLMDAFRSLERTPLRCPPAPESVLFEVDTDPGPSEHKSLDDYRRQLEAKRKRRKVPGK